MADYECHPLWLMGARAGDVAPGSPSLGLSAQLAEALDAWADRFDATLCEDDPRESGFDTEEAANEFAQTGETLARQLAVELGQRWRVIYFDRRIDADREIHAS
ncbi:hypothetical protein [Streptomyces sp. NPDC048272]|uniref:hypothetical protein n=1 Tax=unclassified Streptomyces TaxID=2593676 RepID=UPI0034461A98